MTVEVLERQRFVPNSLAQLKFMRSRAPRLLFSSAYGKGKTRAVCEKADLICRAYPGSVVVLARKTLASMWNTTIKVWEEEVMEPALKPRWRRHAEGGPTCFYPNASILLCMALEDEIRAKSGQFSAAMVDQGEELTESQAAAIAGRLRHRANPWHQIGFAVNPASKNHWMFKEFRPDRGSRATIAKEDVKLPSGRKIPKGQVLSEVVVSGPLDNVENMPPDYEYYLQTLTGVQKLRYVDGLWVAFEGAVYPAFDDDIHVRPRPKEWQRWGGYPPPSWPRYRAMDYGIENPFVCQWWARDPKVPEPGRFWMYREIYHTHRLIPEHGKRIKKLERAELQALRDCALERAETEQIERIAERLSFLEMSASVGDHDRLERELLDRLGIWTEPAEKDVETGIQTVSRMLSVDATGMPHVVFVSDALDELDPDLVDKKKPTCTAEEVGGYHYPPVKEGREIKEQPVKEDDHGCDAMRYLFRTLELAGDLGYARAA